MPYGYDLKIPQMFEFKGIGFRTNLRFGAGL